MSSLLTPLGGGVASPQSLNSGNNVDASGNYDWNSEENIIKWKGTFVTALQKILYNVSRKCHKILFKIDIPESTSLENAPHRNF